MRRWTLLPLLALLILGGTAGSKSFKEFGKDHIRVDGERLEYRRTVELSGEGDRLEIESALGDLEIHAVAGDEFRLRVEIYEYEPDDLDVDFSRGRISLHSRDGHAGAVGAVWAEVPRDADLELSTGYGEIDIEGMKGCRDLVCATGLGDVTLSDLEEIEEIEVATGKGDIRLGPATDIQFAELATGMGSIKVHDAEVDEIDTATGMGSIRFLDCRLGDVSGGTGMGKVRFKRTEYRRSDIESGFGGVSGD